MFKPFEISKDKETNYKMIVEQLTNLIEPDNFMISNFSNAAALLFYSLPDINWAGFYYFEDGILKLGPFQGLPACTKIDINKGVCGKSFRDEVVMNVKNVHDFEGHIACDSRSQSEIVLPIFKDGKCIGVLDIDAPIVERFDNIDEIYLAKIVEILENSLTK